LAAGPVAAQEKVADKGKTYHVPYRLTDTGHVLVRVKINGKGPYNYIIDTGAPVTFIPPSAAKKLGMEPDQFRWATAERFEIEGGVVAPKAKLRVETPFQLEGMNALNFAGVELHGIIGYDVLARYKMEFDFTRPKMRWTRLDFQPKEPEFLKGKAGKGGGADGLSAIGGIMKIVAMFIGKRPSPKLVPRGFVGVELEDEKGAVVIDHVYPDSPAAKAHLKKGDRIVEVKGEQVASVKDVLRHTGELPAGREVEFRIRRGEEDVRVTVTTGKGL
jgi:hypothetical protein